MHVLFTLMKLLPLVVASWKTFPDMLQDLALGTVGSV